MFLILSYQFTTQQIYVNQTLRIRIRVVSAVGRFGRVVSALFWGESIRPILMGRFGRESFRPWVVSASLNIGAKSTYFCS